MIYLSHPYEGETKELLDERERFGKFLTAHISNYLPEFPIFNFALNWYTTRMELGLKTTDAETVKRAMEFIGRADAAIFINFPGRDLCERTRMEKIACHRVNVPVVEFPFYRHRFEQQYKQNCLLTEQRRVLNLLRSNLLEQT